MKKDIKILYVEDNDFIREEAVEYLSLMYASVLEASNGEEALAFYKEEKPDIIITDIEMPIVSGLKMVKHIRREDKTTPIIMMTAFMNNEYLLQAIELHLVKYIVKPMSNHKLNMALMVAEECLDREIKECVIQLSKNAYYDSLNQTLTLDNKVVSLTYNERELCNLLFLNNFKVITYGEIKNKIWNYEDDYRDALRSLVSSLRKKLGGMRIKNVSGLGYRLVLD